MGYRFEQKIHWSAEMGTGSVERGGLPASSRAMYVYELCKQRSGNCAFCVEDKRGAMIFVEILEELAQLSPQQSSYWPSRAPLGDEMFLQTYAKECNKDEKCFIKRDLELADLREEGRKNLYMFSENDSLNKSDDYGLRVKCKLLYITPVPSVPPYSNPGWRDYKYCIFECQKKFLCFKIGKPYIFTGGPIHKSMSCSRVKP